MMTSYLTQTEVMPEAVPHSSIRFYPFTSLHLTCQLRAPRVTLKCRCSQLSAQRESRSSTSDAVLWKTAAGVGWWKQRCRGKLEHSGGATRVWGELSEYAIVFLLLAVLGISANTLTPRKSPSRQVLCKCPDHHVEPENPQLIDTVSLKAIFKTNNFISNDI